MILREYRTYGEGPTNPGDLIVEEGARRLAAMSDIDLDRPDWLVVIGTPWLWNLCWPSPKYRLLSDAVASGRYAKKVAIGIGSCFGLHIEPTLSDGKEEVIDLWSRFDLVVCRDKLAARLVPRAKCLPCPSLWFFDAAPVSPSKPLLQITNTKWHPDYDERWDWLRRDREVRSYEEVTRHSRADLEGFLGEFLAYRQVIAQRIHAVLPISPFVQTKCVPVDTRSLTCVRAGIPLHPSNTWGDPAKIRRARDREWSEAYRRAFAGLTGS